MLTSSFKLTSNVLTDFISHNQHLEVQHYPLCTMVHLQDSNDLIQFSQRQGNGAEVSELSSAIMDDICGKCKQITKQNDRRLRCAICLQMHHLSCTQVSVKLYNCLKDSPDYVDVYCEGCSLGAKSLPKV